MIYSKAVITPVAVAAILILGTITIISSTSQASAYISYHKGHYPKGHYHKDNHGYYTKHTRHGNFEAVITGESGNTVIQIVADMFT